MTAAKPDTDTNRRLGDAFAIAFVQWPAVVGFMALEGEGWALAAKIACGVWAGLISLGAIFGRRGAGAKFGLAMTLCAGMLAAFWAAHPGPWMYLWLALLMLCFHAAQRARMEEPKAAPAQEEEERNTLPAK